MSKFGHITKKGGNIFTELGFERDTAAALREKLPRSCQITGWVGPVWPLWDAGQ